MLLFLLVASTVWLALASTAVAVMPRGPAAVFAMWVAPALALVAGHAIMLRWVERRPWSVVGLGAKHAGVRTLAAGFGLGVVAILVPSAILLAAGWLRAIPTGGGDWWGATLSISAVLLMAALTEELLFRGYLFGVLRETIGWRATVLVTSAAFGIVHLANPNSAWQPALLTTLAGVFLGGVLIATGSLYAAWMAHFAWNWVLAAVLHAAVSGVPFTAPRYRVIEAGPDWVTGGPWGPEGGAAAALGMTAGLVYLWVRHGRGMRT